VQAVVVLVHLVLRVFKVQRAMVPAVDCRVKEVFKVRMVLPFKVLMVDLVSKDRLVLFKVYKVPMVMMD
jgi:hypothetical protein